MGTESGDAGGIGCLQQAVKWLLHTKVNIDHRNLNWPPPFHFITSHFIDKINAFGLGEWVEK